MMSRTAPRAGFFLGSTLALSVFVVSSLVDAAACHARGLDIWDAKVQTKQETGQVAVTLTVRIQGDSFTGQINWAMGNDYGKFNTDGFTGPSESGDGKFQFVHRYDDEAIKHFNLQKTVIRVYVWNGKTNSEKKISVNLK